MLAALRTPALARAFSASARTNIAKMIIVGRLAADPEPYTTSNGQEIIRYAVGSSYKSNGEDKVSWFKIAAFEDHSKPYLKTLTKGTLVYVEGSVTTGIIESEDGKSHTVYNISQRNISALARPRPPPASE